MSREQRYVMVMVRLPDDGGCVDPAHMLSQYDVVASFKRPLSVEQVAMVVKAMEGADAHVPGPTSGQDALGLSTRATTCTASGRFWHNRPKAAAESLLLERLRDIEEMTGVRPSETADPDRFVGCYDEYKGGKDKDKGFAAYLGRVMPDHFEIVAEAEGHDVTPNVPLETEGDGSH